MTNQVIRIGGISHVDPEILKAVLPRFFPVAEEPSQKVVRERLRDEHPDYV